MWLKFKQFLVCFFAPTIVNNCFEMFLHSWFSFSLKIIYWCLLHCAISRLIYEPDSRWFVNANDLINYTSRLTAQQCGHFKQPKTDKIADFARNEVFVLRLWQGFSMESLRITPVTRHSAEFMLPLPDDRHGVLVVDIETRWFYDFFI